MNYVLVLQLRGEGSKNYDALVRLEDDLIRRLGKTATVDGHDMGSGERNIFINTADPAQTFLRAKPLLEASHRLETLRAAFRPSDSHDYTVLWPQGSNQPFQVR